MAGTRPVSAILAMKDTNNIHSHGNVTLTGVSCGYVCACVHVCVCVRACMCDVRTFCVCVTYLGELAWVRTNAVGPN